MTAISEAAERLREHESGGDIYPFDGGAMEMGDERALAAAYLAEHPADDGEPITEEWLRSVGFKVSPDFEFLFIEAGLRPGTIEFDPDIGWIIFGSKATRLLETRGDVRRLCAALGIELKAA